MSNQENNRMNMAGELNPEQMEEIAGGDFADDFHCRFDSHKFVRDIHKGSGAKPYCVEKYICSNCGKTEYRKVYNEGGSEVISEAEFDAY